MLPQLSKHRFDLSLCIFLDKTHIGLYIMDSFLLNKGLNKSDSFLVGSKLSFEIRDIIFYISGSYSNYFPLRIYLICHNLTQFILLKHPILNNFEGFETSSLFLYMMRKSRDASRCDALMIINLLTPISA